MTGRPLKGWLPKAPKTRSVAPDVLLSTWSLSIYWHHSFYKVDLAYSNKWSSHDQTGKHHNSFLLQSVLVLVSQGNSINGQLSLCVLAFLLAFTRQKLALILLTCSWWGVKYLKWHNPSVGFCCVRLCPNSTVNFYDFSWDKALRKLWIRNVRQENLIIIRSTTVCSRHFVSTGGRRWLKSHVPRRRHGSVCWSAASSQIKSSTMLQLPCQTKISSFRYSSWNHRGSATRDRRAVK